MKTALVGYTGFVGSNIYLSGKNEIDALYNSKNISEAYGSNPDLLIYAGLRAEKFLANNAPDKDMEMIIQAQDNISRINPGKLVLISTIDVIKTPQNVDENTIIDTEGLHPYGYNRYQLELWVREHYEDALIIRLPALFGKNIKKNFIYDYINVIPSMLNQTKYSELVALDKDISDYYIRMDNGFYKVNVKDEDKKLLKKKFYSLKFSALNFTDSRSKFQFYNLNRLWEDIQTAINNNLTLWHPATEPISAGELYRFLTGTEFENELSGIPADYDFKTIYSDIFNGKNGYISTKETVLPEIQRFVECERKCVD